MEIREKEVTLKHHKTSVEKRFVLRLFLPGDEEAVRKCVEEEYGDTYYRREYYDRDLLRKEIEEGKLILFVACCDGDLCGIQSFISYAPDETRMEAASQIFRKIYRGYGLPFELVKYTYEAARTLGPSCIYASTVIFHSITQKMCEDVGMTAVAFNFGSHLTSRMHNSYNLGKSEKYGQAILIMPVGKRDAGDIYIHSDIEASVRRLYDKLGVSVNIISKAAGVFDDKVPAAASLSVTVNDREQSICVKVDTIGRDLIERIREVISSHAEKFWTIQLILPVNEGSAMAAYKELKDEGFFYTGIRPLCSGKEQILMQYTGDVYFCFEEFSFTDDFQTLLGEVLDLRRER